MYLCGSYCHKSRVLNPLATAEIVQFADRMENTEEIQIAEQRQFSSATVFLRNKWAHQD